MQTCGDGITAMIKELAESRAAVGASGLFPINGVQRLVDKQTQCTQDEGPRWSLQREREEGREGGWDRRGQRRRE